MGVGHLAARGLRLVPGETAWTSGSGAVTVSRREELTAHKYTMRGW